MSVNLIIPEGYEKPLECESTATHLNVFNYEEYYTCRRPAKAFYFNERGEKKYVCGIHKNCYNRSAKLWGNEPATELF